MKKCKIILCLMLVVLFALSLCACNKHICQHVCPVCGKCTDRDCGESACSAKCSCFVQEDLQIHLVEGSLHKRTVVQTDNPFVGAMGSEYSIVCDNTIRPLKAGSFIATHIKNATEVMLEVAPYTNQIWSADAHYIIIGVSEMFEQAGLTMPQDDLATSGYYIKSAGNSVFIMAQDIDGYQMGALAFLREVLGYDCISYDCYIYEKKAETMPIFDIIEKPDFDRRMPPEPVGGSGLYDMGFTDSFIMISGSGANAWHSSFFLLQPEVYNVKGSSNYHPKWYTNETSAYNVTTADLFHGQLCYTAHGDPDEYEAMVQTMTNRCIEWIDMCPDRNVLNIGEQDDYDWCDCPACSACIDKYGASSATYLLFVNDVAERIEEHYNRPEIIEKQGKRNILVTFFAYHTTEMAPVTQNADGSYSPVDGIHCRHNVGVIFAPIKSLFNRTFYEDENKLYADRLTSWSAVCDNIVCWLYSLNTRYFLYPFNTWDSIAETYRYCYTNNCVFMYDQGQWNQNICTGFTKLKEYMDSKLHFDLNQNPTDIMDKFFDKYFGPAAGYMRQFFNEVQVQWEYIDNAYSSQLPGGISDTINLPEYWPQSLVERWDDLTIEAMKSIKDLEISDPDLYLMYKNHIELERVFPLYVKCTTFSGAYSDAQLRDYRLKFKEICTRLNILLQAEHDATGLASLYDTWGI